MDYKYIEQLIERYWQCQTTLEEERILRAFFAQDDVPARLLQWKEVFTYPTQLKETAQLGADFDARMLALVDEPAVVKARTVSMRRHLRPLFKAVAMVAIVLTLGNAIQYSLNRGRNNTDAAETTDGVTAVGTPMAWNDSTVSDSVRLMPYTEVVREAAEDASPTPLMIQ